MALEQTGAEKRKFATFIHSWQSEKRKSFSSAFAEKVSMGTWKFPFWFRGYPRPAHMAQSTDIKLWWKLNSALCRKMPEKKKSFPRSRSAKKPRPSEDSNFYLRRSYLNKTFAVYFVSVLYHSGQLVRLASSPLPGWKINFFALVCMQI